MANLVYYRDEKVVFKDAFEKQIGITDAEIILAKLIRHYKLPKLAYLDWTSGRNHPHADGSHITLNRDWNNVGVLCHELAHHYQKNNFKMRMYYRNLGFNRWHDKKHHRIMKSMINYCRKKNWFEAEIDRRTSVKLPKPEPTEQEVRLKLIARLEMNCKRYQTKIKMYGTKLRKAEKKIARQKARIVMGNPSTPLIMG